MKNANKIKRVPWYQCTKCSHVYSKLLFTCPNCKSKATMKIVP
jgi:lipopolysaccharide biosynthesis regulator YciM